MEMAFTAVFKKVPEGFIAFVEELAGETLGRQLPGLVAFPTLQRAPR
jgi:hypothetical protein